VTTILDTILAEKFYEVAERQTRRPLPSHDLQVRLDDLPSPRDFAGALRGRKAHGHTALIAEVKKASPSAGVIRADFDPVQIALEYQDAGADCLSVLTDERFFQGHDKYLQAVKSAVSLPILRKDFIVDTYQIYEARLLGADAILLIAAALRLDQLKSYRELAQMLGMSVLVEVHTEAEMKNALAIGATLIGINSRDLKHFVTDLATVEHLAPMVPSDSSITLVAESGIKTVEDVARVAHAGAHAILVGETLMRSPDIGKAVKKLFGTA
jgi:indole-3-glycerol phosphate synthase